VPFPGQTRLLISPHMKGAAHFISPGLCEFEEMAFVSHFLRPADWFVDVGANVGAYTLLASGVAGAKTLAIEPSPSTYQYLLRNIRLNDLAEKVTPLNAALGRAEGRTRLTDGLGTENYVSPGGNPSEGIEVRVSSLDSVSQDRRPKLIKIDVEGFETEVIAGAERTLHELTLEAMIIERAGNASRYGYDEAALHRLVQDHAFIPCAYSVADRSLKRLGPDDAGNIIYVRDIESAEKRLRTATAFTFRGSSI